MDERTRKDSNVDRNGAIVPAPEFTPVEPAGALGVPAPPRGFELSPINQRRWQNFKANGRGYWSLWLFLVLFVISLCAEVIANDKPLYISYAGHSYFPAFVSYPETAFGGDFRTRRIIAILTCRN